MALVAIAVFGAIAFYEWWRLVHETKLRGIPRIVVTAAIVACIAPTIITSLIRGGGPPHMTGALAWPGFLGWALFALVFAGLVITDVARLIVWLARRATREKPFDADRRRMLARLTGGAVATFAAAEIGTGIYGALHEPPLVEIEVTLRRLPRVFDGFTIVQLTDLHVGGTIGRDLVQRLVDRTNALAPDIVALTGDLVDDTVDRIRDDLAPLADLRAQYGVYFVTGNHEYYAGVDEWIAYFRSLGVRVLRNERVPIQRGGWGFDLAGIDDHGAARWPGHGPDLAAAMKGRDPGRAVVLLAHQPRQARQAADYDVDFQLSGHTHGGQVWPWHYLVAAQQGGLLAGRYQIGPTQLYVSRGQGYWGPPVRFAAPSELTRVILRGVS